MLGRRELGQSKDGETGIESKREGEGERERERVCALCVQ